MLSLDNVGFAYRRGKPVLEDISARLQTGRIYGLLGRNGEGKSTLLKLLQGFLRPQNGKICYEESGLESWRRPVEILSEIFYLPENYTVPQLSLEGLGLAYGPFYQKFDPKRMRELCSMFDVELTQPLSRLSLGQQKKAMLSFALASGCRLLLFDEPTNGLDIPSKTIFRQLLIEELKEDRCMVISSHQVRDLEGMLDHLLVLHQHRIVLDAGLSELEERLAGRIEDRVLKGALYSQPLTGGQIYNLILREDLGTAEQVKLDLEALFIWATSEAGRSLCTEISEKELLESV